MQRLQATALILLSFSAIFLSGCKEKNIIGEGPVTETVRDVSSFTKLNIAGRYNVSFEAGQKQMIRIAAQANLMPYITTKVQSDTLSVKADDSTNLSYQIIPNILITAPNISEITLSGANKIAASKLNTQTLSVNTKGSNQVTLSGKTASLTITSSGANEIHAENLQAENTTITITGSSNVLTTTTNNLNAQINGYGKIGYTGSPKSIKQEIHGSGVIRQI